MYSWVYFNETKGTLKKIKEQPSYSLLSEVSFRDEDYITIVMYNFTLIYII